MKHLRVFFAFIRKWNRAFGANGLFMAANSLTFRMMLSVFPTLIVILTALTGLNLSYGIILRGAQSVLPESVMSIFLTFLHDMEESASPNLFSLALLLAVFYSSAGFYSLIVGIRKAFNFGMNFKCIVKMRLFSVLLVVICACFTVVYLYALILSENVLTFLQSYSIFKDTNKIANSTAVIIGMGAIVIFTVISYRIALEHKVRMLAYIPGIVYTLVLSYLACFVFGFYLRHFAMYSMVYGSISTVFVFCIWLNIIALIILHGSQLNALLFYMTLNREKMKREKELSEMKQ